METWSMDHGLSTVDLETVSKQWEGEMENWEGFRLMKNYIL